MRRLRSLSVFQASRVGGRELEMGFSVGPENDVLKACIAGVQELYKENKEDWEVNVSKRAVLVAHAHRPQ